MFIRTVNTACFRKQKICCISKYIFVLILLLRCFFKLHFWRTRGRPSEANCGWLWMGVWGSEFFKLFCSLQTSLIIYTLSEILLSSVLLKFSTPLRLLHSGFFPNGLLGSGTISTVLPSFTPATVPVPWFSRSEFNLITQLLV